MMKRRFVGPLVILLAASPASIARAQDVEPRGPAVISAPPALKPYLNVHALLVGIDNYRAISPLSEAEKDAKDLNTLFKTRYRYDTRLLLGGSATKQAIEDALRQYRSTLGVDDSLIVFFAGHGDTVPTTDGGRTGFLLPYDANLDLKDKHNLEVWRKEAIEMQDIARIASQMKARHVLFLVDACYSGFIGRRSDSLSSRPDLKMLLEGKSRLVMTAGTEDQQSFELKELGNGIFTHSLLQLLNSDSPLAARELYTLLRRQVAEQMVKLAPNEPHKRMLPQLREIQVENGEFVFIPRVVNGVVATVKDLTTAATAAATRLIGRAPEEVSETDLLEIASVQSYKQASNLLEREQYWRAKIKHFDEMASLGKPYAMAALFYAFRKGIGTDANPERAAFWAREAYDTGSVAGKYVLGRCYAEGIGTQKNALVAEQLIEQASAAGFPLAVLHTVQDLKGRAPADAQRAIQSLRELSAKGILLANIALAHLETDSSSGIPQNIPDALRLLLPAAQNGIPAAQLDLFKMYSFGQPGFPTVNAKEALPWLQKAADAGEPEAQFYLALLYDASLKSTAILGVQRNLTDSNKWAQLSAAQGYSGAHLLLARHYIDGAGVSINFEQARTHLEEARKDPKNASAMYLEASLRDSGKIYPRDQSKAMTLYYEAAQLGHLNAMAQLGGSYGMCQIMWRDQPPKPGYEYCAVLPAGTTNNFNQFQYFEFHWLAKTALGGHQGAKKVIEDPDYLPSLPDFIEWEKTEFAEDQRLTKEQLLKLSLSRRLSDELLGADKSQGSAVKSSQSDAQLLQRGRSLQDAGDYKGAIAIYTQLLKDSKDTPAKGALYRHRGVCYSKLNRYTEALEDYKNAVAFEPNNHINLSNVGAAYRRAGNLEVALLALTEAIRLQPSDSLYYFYRGETYALNKQYDLAIVDFSKSLELKSDYGPAYQKRGDARKARGDTKGAESDYKKAKELGTQLQTDRN